MAGLNESSQERSYAVHREPVARESTYTTLAAGSALEGLGGLGVVALSIVGLAGVVPRYMAPIATIAFGVALAAEGASIATRFSQLAHNDGLIQKAEIGGGAGGELVGGLAGGVLGILALIGIAPIVLVSVAAIVFGAAILLGSGTESRISSLAAESGERVISGALLGTAGAEVLVGVAAIALGIIALTGTAPMSLNLIAMLVLGAGATIQATSVGGAMAAVFR